MTKPLELGTILSEFDDNAQAWVLQDRDSGKSDTDPQNADSFVVHSPNEVYGFLRDRP
jgi:hypothetical protein